MDLKQQDIRPKYARWLALGRAFANDVTSDRKMIAEARAANLDSKDVWHLAGRIMLLRRMGRLAFVTLEDGSDRIQLAVRAETLQGEALEDWECSELGDVIEVWGALFITRTGELTVEVSGYRLLTKALESFPDKFHGVSDPEFCRRRRYVDLMMNPKTRERFRARSRLIQALRDFLLKRSFLEVETPMLHPLAGGAQAMPFVTHHQALDMPLFLRIAPELYLKRLLVGGLERVFEMNRSFRNEGLSSRHNPEFTTMECYQAYASMPDMMALAEGLLREMVQQVLKGLQVPYQEHVLDFSVPFKVLTITQAVRLYAPVEDPSDLKACEAYLRSQGITPTGLDQASLHFDIFEHAVESHLIQPTFITDYPASTSPLARQRTHQPEWVDRFELFIGGFEVANAFSELNDPLEQAKRFAMQMQAKAEGHKETMPYDQDYIDALSYGLPPCAGMGIGIDRVVMLLTNTASIKDVIFFPHLRALESSDEVLHGC